MLRFNILYLYESSSLCGRLVDMEIVAILIRMWRKMHFSKLEMKFVGFSFLVSENEIISGEIRKDIYWSFYWYVYKFIHQFSDKLMVLFTVSFFFRDRLDIGQKFPDDGRASHDKISLVSLMCITDPLLYL